MCDVVWCDDANKMENLREIHFSQQKKKKAQTHTHKETATLCFQRMNSIAKAHPMYEVLKLISNVSGGFLHANWR